MRDTPHRPHARALLHPLWWAALVTLALNDHLLKAAWPGLLTGKLSDLAGLLVAPTLLAALLASGPLVRCPRRAWLLAHVAVGAVFSAINLWPAAARGWEALMAVGPLPWRVTVDPTDLVALPALALSWWLFSRPRAATRLPAWGRRAVAGAGLGFGLLASMGTSPPHEPVVMPGNFFASNTLVNATTRTLQVRVRELAPDVAFDCDAVMPDARAHFVPDHFGPATTFSLAPGAVLALWAGASDDPEACRAVVIEGADLPGWIVVWRVSDFPEARVDASAPGGGGLEALNLVESDSGAVQLNRQDPAYRLSPAPVGRDPVAGACAPTTTRDALDWSPEVPTGTHLLAHIEVAPNGCAQLLLDNHLAPGSLEALRRWYVCAPPLMWSLEVGDVVAIDTYRDARGEGVSLASPRSELWLSRGAEAHLFLPRGPSRTVEADDACDYALLDDGCQTIARPARLRVDGAPVGASIAPQPLEGGAWYFVRGYIPSVWRVGCTSWDGFGGQYVETAVQQAGEEEGGDE